MYTFLYADGSEYKGDWEGAPQEGVAVIVTKTWGLTMGGDVYFLIQGEQPMWSNSPQATLQAFEKGIVSDPYTALKKHPVKFGELVLDAKRWADILDRARQITQEECGCQ